MKQSKITIPGIDRVQASMFENEIPIPKYYQSFPEVKQTEKELHELLNNFDPKMGLGLDYEFDPITYRPTIVGISDVNYAVSVPATEKITRDIFDACVSRASTLVGYSVFGAEKPIIDKAIRRESEVRFWDDGLRSFFLANSVLCKSPGKEESDEGGSLGFMNLSTASTFCTGIPVYKVCRGNLCYGPCPYHKVFDYNGVDSWAGLQVHHASLARFHTMGGTREVYDRRMALADLCYKIQQTGIHIDRKAVKELEAQMLEKKKTLFAGHENFNPASGQQIIAHSKTIGTLILKADIKQIQKSCEKELKKLGFADITAFEEMHGEGQQDFDPEIVAKKLEKLPGATLSAAFFYRLYKYKKTGKGTKSWFADKYFGKDDLLHPRFNDTGTSLGRLSSSKPNFQNVPRNGFGEEIRKCIVAPEGFDIVKADFSNLELRIILHQAGFDITQILKLDPFQWLVDNSKGLFDDVAKRMNTGFTARDWAKSVSHACLNSAHDVLTPYGWIPISEWSGEKIAVWDADFSIKFETPKAYQIYDINENINTLSAKGFSSAATKNHTYPVTVSGTWNKIQYSKLQKVCFDDFLPSGRVPITGVLDNECEKFSDEQIIRAVAVQADGSLAGRKVKFHVVKERKKQRLEMYFGEVSKCKCMAHEGYYGYFDFQSSLIDDTKQFTWEFLNMSQRQRLLFLDEILKWDGNISGYRKSYCTTNRQCAEVVQTVAHLAGKQSLIRYSERPSGFNKNGCKLYTVSINNSQHVSVKNIKNEEVPFCGKVYCFTTSTGYFLTRHANNISITGNSNLLEGLTLLSPLDLMRDHTKKLERVGALKVFRDWKFRDKVVGFTGANLAERLLGSKTEVNRAEMLKMQWDIYFNSFPILNTFHRKLLADIENASTYKLPGGMVIDLYGPDLDDCKIAAAGVGQGGGAAFVQEAMIRFTAKTGIIPFCQVHDDINVYFNETVSDEEVLDKMRILVETSSVLPGMICPAKVLRGKNWKESDMKGLGKIY